MRFMSTRTHAVLDLVVGIILILAPNLFGFNAGALSDIPRILGLLVVISELITDNGLSLVRWIPMPAHLALDAIIGAFLMISPWFYLSGSDQGAHNWAPQLALGLLIFGSALVTKEAPDRPTLKARVVRRVRRA